jgi:hypothetical protein
MKCSKCNCEIPFFAIVKDSTECVGCHASKSIEADREFARKNGNATRDMFFGQGGIVPDFSELGTGGDERN